MAYTDDHISKTKEKTEVYHHKTGMGTVAHGNKIHDGFPDIGDNLTTKHGSPSEMHAEGVHRHISMTQHPMTMSQVV